MAKQKENGMNKTMKVLWFTNTPCSAIEKIGLKINIGGWLVSLEQEIKNIPDVELAICFYYNEPLKPFFYKGTHYYPVYRKNRKSKLGRLFDRMFINSNDDENEVQELIKVINDFNPQLIHVHGTEENFGLILEYTQIPVVISIQGLINPYLEKFFSGVPKIAALKHESFIDKLLFSGILRTFKLFGKKAKREATILKQTKFIIGRTDWDRRITKLFSPDNQYFVGNEILRTSFYQQPWNKNKFSNPLQIITITSDSIYKGFETIIKTAELLSKYSNYNFTWKIIGLSNKSTIVKIVNSWLKCDYKNNKLELVGTKNEIEIYNLLISSDIYCQVSHIENSPNSLCEAMLLGMPIIATNVGGTSSLLIDKKEGILVQEGDYYAIAGAIIEMNQNFNKAKDYAEAARKVALNRHNKQQIASDIYSIYTKIINE